MLQQLCLTFSVSIANRAAVLMSPNCTFIRKL